MGAGLAALGAVGVILKEAAHWLWQGVGVGWPGLRKQTVWVWGVQGLWQVQRMVLVGYLGLALSPPQRGDLASWGLGLGCLVCPQEQPQVTVTCPQEEPEVIVTCPQEEPQVTVVRQTDGSSQATLSGHFTLTVAGDQPFRRRLLVLFLSLLDAPGATRGSRRTRDGRTPWVRQLQLAEWFGVPQPDISRWLQYWQTADWANLLSLHSAEVLTAELVARIVEVCATFPTWGVAQVYHYLRQQGGGGDRTPSATGRAAERLAALTADAAHALRFECAGVGLARRLAGDAVAGPSPCVARPPGNGPTPAD